MNIQRDVESLLASAEPKGVLMTRDELAGWHVEGHEPGQSEHLRGMPRAIGRAPAL
jgi:hypothetical protein